MRVYDIIKKKRDGFELTREELSLIVKGAVSGSVPDYQLSAFLMAVYLNGFSERETLDFTLEIATSGDTINAKINGIKVDKHSTGGVGDKTSLVVLPAVACYGLKALKMSGRGLGHTGGTVDKLESIKGFNTELEFEEFISICEKQGISIIGQTKNLAPADKIFYALRDVTATVDSIPLIASSIMGKKLALLDDVIVLDVKTGDGAFMKSFENSLKLAETMVNIGKGANKKISALITDMSEPLGVAVGNSLEVKEAIDLLQGKIKGDLYEVCKALFAEIAYLSGLGDYDTCLSYFDEVLNNGSAYRKFVDFVTAQGGNLEDFETENYLAKYSKRVISDKDGYIFSINAEKVGVSSLYLGAGRNKKEDKIDYRAGIILNKKVGDKVNKGDVLCTLYAEDENKISKAELEFVSAITISKSKPKKRDIIIKTVR